MQRLAFLLIALAGYQFVVADEYYFNFKNWVQPILSEVPVAAMRGAHKAPSLQSALGTSAGNKNIQLVEFQIRSHIGQQLQQHMDHLLTQLQNLVNIIVRDFAMNFAGKYRESIGMIDQSAPLAEVANSLTDDLIQQARKAINTIIVELKRQEAIEEIDDKLTGQALQEMIVRIGKELLQNAEWVNMEATVLSQVKAVLDNVFAKNGQEIEGAIVSDLEADMKSAIQTIATEVNGHEAEFHQWMEQQVAHAVSAARPHIGQLSNFAKQVVSDASKLCRDVCADAYNYFAQYKDDLGVSWDRIDSIARRMVDTDYSV